MRSCTVDLLLNLFINFSFGKTACVALLAKNSKLDQVHGAIYLSLALQLMAAPAY